MILCVKCSRNMVCCPDLYYLRNGTGPMCEECAKEMPNMHEESSRMRREIAQHFLDKALESMIK